MSGSGYAKLFSQILTSSLWGEADSVRIVWISLLALADRNGEVAASVPGLARLANVSRERCEEALGVLSSPDPDDRSRVADGRRIEAIQGGWRLVNYATYRDKGRGQDRSEYLKLKKQESRARCQQAVNKSTNVNQSQPIVAVAVAVEVAVTEEEKKAPSALPAGLDTPEFRQAWEDWQAYRREAKFPAWKSATVKAKLAELAGWGSERAVKAIRLSISNGWRGLFDRDDKATPAKASAVKVGDLSDADREAYRKLGSRTA